MSFQFPTPMTAAQLAERGTNMMDEATATMRLASELAEFERLTGRSLILTEARTMVDFGTTSIISDGSHVTVLGDGFEVQSSVSTISEPEAPDEQDGPVEPIAEAPRACRIKARNMNWAGLCTAERRIVQHLEGLPDDHSAETDMCIAKMLMSGVKHDAAALTLGMTPEEVLARWKSFLCPEVLGENGKPSIDGQKHLLAALKYLAEDSHA